MAKLPFRLNPGFKALKDDCLISPPVWLDDHYITVAEARRMRLYEAVAIGIVAFVGSFAIAVLAAFH